MYHTTLSKVKRKTAQKGCTSIRKRLRSIAGVAGLLLKSPEERTGNKQAQVKGQGSNSLYIIQAQVKGQGSNSLDIILAQVKR